MCVGGENNSSIITITMLIKKEEDIGSLIKNNEKTRDSYSANPSRIVVESGKSGGAL